MFYKHFLAGLPVALSVLSLSSAVHAEYQVYQPYQQNNQGISYQHTSFQTLQPWQAAEAPLPPVILPYVPFDNQPGDQIIQPHYPPPVNAYPPRINHYQPQARTWRARPAPPPHASLSPARQRIIDIAYQQMGIRYRWGGNTPREGFDCSGFTKFTHRYLKTRIPRTAAQQSRASRTISRSQLRPGDMIFFKTRGRHVNHVGIYLGNGRFIHAASGGGKVMTDDLRKNYWQKRLVKYGTFLR